MVNCVVMQEAMKHLMGLVPDLAAAQHMWDLWQVSELFLVLANVYVAYGYNKMLVASVVMMLKYSV